MGSLKSTPNVKMCPNLLAESVNISNSKLDSKLSSISAMIQATYIDMLYEASDILSQCGNIQTTEINKWL